MQAGFGLESKQPAYEGGTEGQGCHRQRSRHGRPRRSDACGPHQAGPEAPGGGSCTIFGLGVLEAAFAGPVVVRQGLARVSPLPAPLRLALLAVAPTIVAES